MLTVAVVEAAEEAVAVADSAVAVAAVAAAIHDLRRVALPQ